VASFEALRGLPQVWRGVLPSREIGVYFSHANEGLTKATEGPVYFRAADYGHGTQLWKDIVKAYLDGGFQGIMSTEKEDAILAGEVGVERAAYVVQNAGAELLGSQA